MNVEIRARGHLHVRATHYNTLEVTKDTHLTPKGDCIIAVAADKAMHEIPQAFKDALRKSEAALSLRITCNGREDCVTAHGHPDLPLTHATDLVVRKSGFICPRTLAVGADKAAKDLDGDLVEELKKGAPVTVTLRIA